MASSLVCSEISEMLRVLPSISLAVADCSSAADAIWWDICSMVFTASDIVVRAVLTLVISSTLFSVSPWHSFILVEA